MEEIGNITGQTGPGPTYGYGTASLDRDAFLRLLVTQMRMQDPLEPMRSEELMAQLSQLASVEQLETANLQLALLQRALAVSQALCLVGRSVATADGTRAGQVEAVVIREGQPRLLVAGSEIDPGDVARVW